MHASSPASARDKLIAQFGLVPHPEGGFFRETYRAADRVLRAAATDDPAVDLAADRAASTAIYYMLSDDAFSAWHRIRSDEIWHFYAGDPIDVHVIDANGTLQTHRLGNALEHDHTVFQAMVPAGHWFAATRIAGNHGFALAGCTVAPGFEFSEFELADARALRAVHPQHTAILQRLASTQKR